MLAQQSKQSISIWGIIQPMMQEEAKNIKDNAQYFKRPHLFKHYSIKKDVRSIYKHFMDIKFLPHALAEGSCYYNVQVVQKFCFTQAKTSQMMIQQKVNEMMIIEEEKEEIIKHYNLKREQNYQKIIQEAQNKEKGLFFCRNFSQTFEEIITKILGTCQKFQDEFELRIYFLWKHFQFTFIGQHAIPLKLIGLYQENYDQLFRRAICIYPSFQSMLKQMIQWQGVRKRELNFKKLRIYLKGANDKEYKYKYKFPNAKICLSPEGVFYLKIMEKQ